MFLSNPKKLPVRSQVSVGLTNDGLVVIEDPDGVAILMTADLAVKVAGAIRSMAPDCPGLAAAASFSALLKLGGAGEGGVQ